MLASSLSLNRNPVIIRSPYARYNRNTCGRVTRYTACKSVAFDPAEVREPRPARCKICTFNTVGAVHTILQCACAFARRLVTRFKAHVPSVKPEPGHSVQTDGGLYYTVRKGDSISSVSRQFSVPVLPFTVT
eukprot:3224992-Pyramimonas_sp.AAC.1